MLGSSAGHLHAGEKGTPGESSPDLMSRSGADVGDEMQGERRALRL